MTGPLARPSVPRRGGGGGGAAHTGHHVGGAASKPAVVQARRDLAGIGQNLAWLRVFLFFLGGPCIIVKGGAFGCRRTRDGAGNRIVGRSGGRGEMREMVRFYLFLKMSSTKIYTRGGRVPAREK